MKHSNYLNFVRRNVVENCERETTYYCASKRSMHDGIQGRAVNDPEKRVVDALHKLKVKILPLVRIPFAGFGEFCIGFGSEPNDHFGLAGVHEFSFDFFPCPTLTRCLFERLKAPIEFVLLRIAQFKCLIFFGYCVPNLLHQQNPVRDAEFLCSFRKLGWHGGDYITLCWPLRYQTHFFRDLHRLCAALGA